jgi:hypothetical protein
VAALAAVSGTWMAADGVRALVTGDYVRVDGELGPWTNLVAVVGLEPLSSTMKITFVAYGCAQLVAAGGYHTRRRWGRTAVAITAAGSLWYLVLGTASGVTQLALLLVGRHTTNVTASA